jgi:fused signal recognition particle receptor
MFGFLRRKKPADPAAPPVDADAMTVAPDDPSAADGASQPFVAGASPVLAVSEDPALERELERQALAAAPQAGVEPEPAPAPDPAPAPAAKQGFWSRFIPGGGATAPTGPSAPIEPALPSTVLRSPVGPAATATSPVPALPAAVPAPPPVDAPDPSTAPVLVPAETADRKPWLERLKQGLSRTRGNIAVLFVGVKVDEALFEDLETALLSSDAGVETTRFLLEALRERVKKERLVDGQQVKAALRALLVELMLPLEQPIDIDRATPLVVMIAGVNGAGKTTSIGKLARHLRREGKSVLLAAGDTFRAAAREQLALWGSRNEVDVISQQGGDPAAVAFDAVAAGRARGTGVVMIDTAGRLPTQQHLMDELRKVRRVLGKAMDGSPHEVLLVLDGNTGQNMLAQVRAFDDAVQLTGLIVTKLDGTAKGGALAALAHTRRERPIPVYFIGVGEGIDDLQAFSAEEFAGALVG